MNKTKRTALIIVSCVLVLAAVVGISFAVWSNLEKEHVFTLKAGELELNISSFDVLNSDQPISFDNPITMSFKVKVEGEKSTLRFSINSFQYSLVEGQFLPLSPDLFNVELPRTIYGIGGSEEPSTATCQVKVSLSNAYDYDSFDPVLMGKKFRFNLKIKAETYTAPVMYDIIYNNMDGATHDNITQWSVETNHEFKDAEKFGYTFDGWYTDESLSPESRITELTQDNPNVNTLNVYAKWIPIKYAITYDFGSGYQPENIPEEYTIEDVIDFSLYTPLNENKTLLFGGYYLDAEFTKPITEISVGTTGAIDIFVKWIQQYNITYVDSLSVENANPTVFSALDSEIILSDLTANGYEFDGWYNAEGVKVTTIDTSKESDITLTAKWIANTYNINWNYSGGEEITDIINKYTYDKAENIESYIPIRSGYTFDGWYLNDTKITEIAVGTIGDIDILAKWTPIVYSITWNTNGGTLTGAPERYTVESAVIDPSAFTPTRDGYAFDGWFTDEECATPAVTISTGSIDNKTFFAKWIANTYNINWNYSGGEEITDIINKYTYDKAENIESYIPIRNGYTFDGWYLNDTKITEIAVGTIGDINIVAKWTPIVYNITWNTGLGSLTGAPESYTIESTDIDLSAFTPTRDGYEFGGWYTDESFGTQVSSITTGSTGDKTFYAKWDIITYTIEWNLNGGETAQELPTTYDITNTDNLISNLSISKAGNKFLGWYGNAELTGTPITEVGAGTVGNIKLFAKWELITYTISYMSDYGDVSMLPETYTVESEIDLTQYSPTPYDSNYKFAGFFKDNAYSEQITAINAGQTGNIDIYVKWLEVYTITWNIGDGAILTDTPPTNYTAEESIDLSAYQPTKDGYTFTGWHNGTEIVTAIPTGSSGNIVLTAQWEEIIVPA